MYVRGSRLTRSLNDRHVVSSFFVSEDSDGSPEPTLGSVMLIDAAELERLVGNLLVATQRSGNGATPKPITVPSWAGSNTRSPSSLPWHFGTRAFRQDTR